MVVDGPPHLDVVLVAVGGVASVGCEETPTHAIDVVGQVLFLGGPLRELQIFFLGVNHGHAHAAHGHPGVTGIEAVDLHDVGAGDVRKRFVFGLQFGARDPFAAHADLLGEHIKPLVLIGCQRPQLIDEHLHEPSPR